MESNLILHSAEFYTQSPENQYLERKSAKKAPKDIVQHIVAFANAEGGALVVGVEDDGIITSFRNPNSKPLEQFKNIALLELRDTPILANYTTLPVINNKGEKDCILVISVSPSVDRVIKYGSKVFLRSNDQTLNLAYEQIQQLEYDRGQRYFEDEIVENSSIDDIDEDIMDLYRNHMDIKLTTKEILVARNMLIHDRLTNAGILLFSKNPTKYLPQARLRFVKYDGMKAQVGTSINIIKEKTFDGPIPQIITKSKDFINAQLREFQYLDIDGKFKKMPEYPEFAWFEGIVNALTHRNYSIRGEHIKFIMYDDRVEISSPGLLPNIVTIENILTQRYSRNPRIARVLSEFGWVKEMNEGVKRIYSEMESFFLERPTYSEPHNNVLLLLENNILNRNVRINENLKKMLSASTFDQLTELEKIIIQLAFNNETLTVKQASFYTQKSLVTTRNIMKTLVKRNILKWHGTSNNDPTQYYTLAYKN